MELTLFISSSIGFVTMASAIVLALTEVVKYLGLSSKYAPLVSVIIGATFGYFFATFGNLPYNILAGVLAGLTASGFYSGVKKVTE